MARPKIADSVKVARGTHRPSRSTGDVPKEVLIIDVGRPTLNLGAQAMDLWRDIMAMKQVYGGVTTMDIDNASKLCWYYERWVDTLDKTDVEIDANGNTRTTAYAKNRETYRVAMRDLEKQIGLDIQNRLRKPTGEEKPKNDDPLGAFVL